LKLRIHLFEWPSRHNVHLALPLMLVLSFFLHAACMFIFHATFPSSQGSRERSVAVYNLLPDSPEGARIGPMLAASDPALFSSTKVFGRNVWKLPQTAYVASFDEEVPSLATLPAPLPSQFLPPDSGTTPVSAGAVLARTSPSPEPAVPTAVRFGGSLEGRGWTSPQNFDFAALGVLPRQGLLPAEFLVAVSPEGIPMHLFPQGSSGDENLDRAALKYLAGCRFAEAPAERDAVWGTATFVWGADVRQDNRK
jgi:hypothetical protein